MGQWFPPLLTLKKDLMQNICSLEWLYRMWLRLFQFLPLPFPFSAESFQWQLKCRTSRRAGPWGNVAWAQRFVTHSAIISSHGFSNTSSWRWNPFVRVWAGVCELHTVILLFPTISIRQWCSSYTRTLLISSLFCLGSLFLFGQGMHLGSCSNKEFLNHHFWVQTTNPGPCTLRHSLTRLHCHFPQFFSKRHLSQDLFAVWSSIFFFWPSLEKKNSFQNLQCVKLTVPFPHLLHFLCLVRTAQFCLYGHSLEEKRPIIHRNHIGRKKKQNNKPYYSVLLGIFFSLSLICNPKLINLITQFCCCHAKDHMTYDAAWVVINNLA